jgi:hypothetical protein
MGSEKQLNILGIIIKLIIIAPALIAGLLVMGSGVNADSPELVQQTFMDSVSFSAVMNISFISIIAAVILILVFFAVLLATRPGTAIKSILGIIIATVVFFILYSAGTTDTVESLDVQGGISASESTMNFTHAGIWTAIIGMVISSVLALFMGFIMKLVRNK